MKFDRKHILFTILLIILLISLAIRVWGHLRVTFSI